MRTCVDQENALKFTTRERDPRLEDPSGRNGDDPLRAVPEKAREPDRYPVIDPQSGQEVPANLGGTTRSFDPAPEFIGAGFLIPAAKANFLEVHSWHQNIKVKNIRIRRFTGFATQPPM